MAGELKLLTEAMTIYDIVNDIKFLFQGDVKVTSHFKERLKQRITDANIPLERLQRMLKELFRKYGSTMANNKKRNVSIVLKEINPKLNIKIIMYYDNGGTPGVPYDDTLSLVTVISRKDFQYRPDTRRYEV
jgi:hypothetical protein